MEEYEVARSSNTQLKVFFYLGELNTYWKRYDQLFRCETSLIGEVRESEMHKANIHYMHAELRLAELGYHWVRLKYDKETKTYSLPE